MAKAAARAVQEGQRWELRGAPPACSPAASGRPSAAHPPSRPLQEEAWGQARSSGARSAGQPRAPCAAGRAARAQQGAAWGRHSVRGGRAGRPTNGLLRQLQEPEGALNNRFWPARGVMLRQQHCTRKGCDGRERRERSGRGGCGEDVTDTAGRGQPAVAAAAAGAHARGWQHGGGQRARRRAAHLCWAPGAPGTSRRRAARPRSRRRRCGGRRRSWQARPPTPPPPPPRARRPPYARSRAGSASARRGRG